MRSTMPSKPKTKKKERIKTKKKKRTQNLKINRIRRNKRRFPLVIYELYNFIVSS